MAIGRLSMKVGTAGKARPHAAYIAREGQYTGRLERGEKLEATEAGNMPTWAQSNPQAFWQAADAFERKNGTTYREMEIALPRELSAAERLALTREFVRLEIGDRHAYQFAIHCPAAVDGQEQPHVHLMFSERQQDGIERDPEQYFKRYNAKAPEKGGCRKGYGPSAGQTLTKAERVAELKELRGRWAAMCNAHLERAGVEQRIDMRSNAERGIGLEPERKQLPSQWRGQGRANVIEFRQARAELARAVPDAAAEILRLEQDRKRAEPNHELRRGSDGLTAEQPAVPQRPQAERAAPDPLAGFRAVIERAEADDDWLALDVAKAQLAVAQEFQAAGKYPLHHLEAITQEGQQRAFAGLAQPSQAKTEPVKAANKQNPEAIKREWQNEKARQFTLIVNRAKELHTRTAVVMERQEGKLANHDQARPAEPAGLFAGFKKAAHGQALAAWRGVRVGLEKRWTQLQNRLHLIGEYMRQAGPYEQPTRGERLAEKKAAQARPELASNFQQLREQEKAALAARYQATIAPQQTRPKGRSR